MLLKNCTKPGCTELIPQMGPGRCKRHQIQAQGQVRAPSVREYDRQRRSDKKLYDSAAWKRIRKHILAEQPVCVKCKRKASTDVDHIDGNRYNLNHSNLQGLCHSCHSRKTAMYDNPRTKRKRSRASVDERGYPLGE